MTWHGAAGLHGAHGSMQHQYLQQQLARVTSMSVVVVCNVLCAGSQPAESARASCTCISLVRCAPTAQLWNRWPHVRSVWPVPFPVARRPSLYREQSADDRRRHGSVYDGYSTGRVRPKVVRAKGPAYAVHVRRFSFTSEGAIAVSYTHLTLPTIYSV